ncbi:MAG: hypothetical protein AAF772_12580 [Acidobacteriota bacterium]
MRALRLVVLATALLLLVTTAAQARLFTVTLKSGATFETRYRPVPAEWDENVAMILTDRGNWIALELTDVVDVVSSVEASGFGRQIDASTIELGWAYNAAQEEGLEGDPGQQPPQQPQAPAPPAQQNFSLEQFVDTGGVGGGGLDVRDY